MVVNPRLCRAASALWRRGPFTRRFGDAAQYEAEKTPITSKLWAERNLDSSVASDSKENAGKPSKKITCILEKNPKDSRRSVNYDFTQSAALSHIYTDFAGHIQQGKLLEDLDALAGNIAASHCDDSDSDTERVNLVTAAVDKITQTNSIPINDDYTLIGQIIFVGKSSLDILIEMHRSAGVNPTDGIPDRSVSTPVLTSCFTFAARDRSSGKAIHVNRLIPETSTEIELQANREKLQKQRRLAKKTDVPIGREVLTPLVERGCAIADMPALAHPNAVLMGFTILENCFVCQPQNVNMAGSVFGGFLMHRAYDLALASCYTFAGAKPRFIEVDKIEFRKPVAIGDLVRLKSRVIYSSDDPLNPTAQCEVICQVVRPERASSFVSNKFLFVFSFQESVSLRRVLPQTYEQAERLVKASTWELPHVRK